MRRRANAHPDGLHTSTSYMWRGLPRFHLGTDADVTCRRGLSKSEAALWAGVLSAGWDEEAADTRWVALPSSGCFDQGRTIEPPIQVVIPHNPMVYMVGHRNL